MNRTTNSINTRQAELIPRQILFGNWDVLSPKLSPNGKYVAYLAPDSRNTLQIWLYYILSMGLRAKLLSLRNATFGIFTGLIVRDNYSHSK